MSLADIILLAGGTLSGLLAGLLFGFSVAVVPSLRDLTPQAHMRAMQIINVKIKNPLFLLSFMGPVLLLPLAAFLHRDSDAFLWLVLASVGQIVGVVGVTAAGNIPLNDALDKVQIDALSDAEAERMRQEYQGVGARWMQWHNLRTIMGTLVTALTFWAALV